MSSRRGLCQRRGAVYNSDMSLLQAEVERRGTQIFDLVDRHPESIFSKAGFYQRMMEFSMRDEHFKVQMFRFVDVLASLRRGPDIVQHLDEYFAEMRNGFAPLVQTGVHLARIVPWVSGKILRWNVSGMARQFIAGRNPAEVMKTLRKRRKQGIGFTVDLLGEAVVSEQEAEEYARRCFELLDVLAAEKNLRDLIAWGRSRGTRFTVRLVKGAYWDYEKIKSKQNGWSIPVWLQKPESDANFEKLTRILLENEPLVTSAFGSHNVRSIAYAQALADQLGIDRNRFEFQLLYGMAGPVKRALVEMGYRVREYSPVGELLPGMSYLVRRLLENTSNEGFLRAKFSEHVSGAQLLRDPRDLVNGAVATSVIPSEVEGSRSRTLEVTSEESIGLSWTSIFARDDGTGRNGATRGT